MREFWSKRSQNSGRTLSWFYLFMFIIHEIWSKPKRSQISCRTISQSIMYVHNA
ncbi:hypothetical protein HanIR_Chr14g0691771 [Helianthus annuus]|nr:hypothetical protein HanIR_Chr14g0691771 [Helianthus annuus]